MITSQQSDEAVRVIAQERNCLDLPKILAEYDRLLGGVLHREGRLLSDAGYKEFLKHVRQTYGEPAVGAFETGVLARGMVAAEKLRMEMLQDLSAKLRLPR